MISHHFILVIQVAAIKAETAEQEATMETEAEPVVEDVVVGVFVIPSLPTISAAAFKLLVEPPSMRTGTLNVNIFINKIRLIVNLPDVQRLDLLAICETRLTIEVPSSFEDTYEYNLFCKDVICAARKQGVGLYIRKNIQSKVIDVSVANTLVVVHVLEWDTSINVFYRPPSYNDIEND